MDSSDDLSWPIDLSTRIIYFPVRHHSPACAWHVGRLIRELRPDSVLIEGPRDATALLPLLVHEDTRMPVALYSDSMSAGSRIVEAGGPPDPTCRLLPDMRVLARVGCHSRAGMEVGATVRFIDLTFPEKVEAHQFDRAEGLALERRSQSLQSEAWFTHSRLLQAACVRTGSRDPDDLWDHLYEVDYRNRDTAEFMRGVLAYCAMARREYTDDTLRGDGCLAREQAMAAAVAEERGRTVVVTGGFHTVALPQTEPAMPKPMKLAPEDNQLVLMRYTFEQLDRLNGYASGMPSPEFYQRAWDEEQPVQLIVEIARDCRQKNLGISTADAIAAVSHVSTAYSPSCKRAPCEFREKTCWTAFAASSSRPPPMPKVCPCWPWHASGWLANAWATCRPKPVNRRSSTTSAATAATPTQAQTGTRSMIRNRCWTFIAKRRIATSAACFTAWLSCRCRTPALCAGLILWPA